MRLSVIVTALALGGFAASAAQAMPAPAIDAGSPSSVVKVDYACGPGWHVTPYGHCRPNARYRPAPPPPYWGHRPPPWAWGGYHPHGYRPYNDGWRRPPPRW